MCLRVRRIVINSDWATIGRAWGVLPAQYDKKEKVRPWLVNGKENGLLKLSFRKFKGVDQKDEDKNFGNL